MTLTQSIAQYGYPFVAIGCFLEGESVIILAAYLAHQGYMSMGIVMGYAFLGAMLSDQTAFHVGKKWGKEVLQRFASWSDAANSMQTTMQKRVEGHAFGAVVGLRFLYGLRTVGTLAIGILTKSQTTKAVSNTQFLGYDAIACAIWVSVYATIGYCFGFIIEYAKKLF